MEMKEIKAQIKDYVRDHYKYYGWYPYDVQVGDTLYTYEQYMDILSMTVQKLSTLSCIRVRIHYNKYITNKHRFFKNDQNRETNQQNQRS